MHLATCATCREPNGAPHCGELRELSLTLLSTSKFPAGADVIRAGECPVGGAGPMARVHAARLFAFADVRTFVCAFASRFPSRFFSAAKPRSSRFTSTPTFLPAA